VSVNLPTVTAQPHTWEGGSLPSPKMCPAPALRRRPEYWLEETPRPEATEVNESRRQFLLKQVCLLVWIVALSLLGYYLISHYVVTLVEVQGRSMTPTLHDGDRFFLNRLAFYFRPPTRGDLVVVRDPGHTDCAVKRIVGLPGDSILIKNGTVFVNGRRLAEPYLLRGTTTVLDVPGEKKVVLGQGNYFLLGDNRAHSEDSRHYGPVLRGQILGLISP
jgi:signal peptidase I